MKEKERAEIISSIKGVDSVVLTGHKKNTRDMSVCKEIKQLIKFAHRKYKNCNINFIFAKGGDKTKNNIPEKDLCEKLGIKMKFGVGGYNKLQSSSRLVDKIRKYQINN